MDKLDSQPIDSRGEFRSVLRNIVGCLRSELDVPGITPFNAEELCEWFRSITPDDIRAVWDGKPQK